MAPAPALIVRSPKNSFSATADRAAVVQRANFLHCHKAACNHSVENGEEALDLLLTVDDFYHYRQGHREPENLRSMEPARFAEPHRPAQDSGASEMHFARFQNDRLVKRTILVAIAFANENAQES